jgi:hypothetical protein
MIAVLLVVVGPASLLLVFSTILTGLKVSENVSILKKA